MSRSAWDARAFLRAARGVGNSVALASELRLSLRMTKRLLLATVLVGAAACEHGVDLDGTVIAPVDVQALFSADAPGQLLVVTTVPTVGEIRDERTVFCLPQDQDRRVSVKAFDFGCAPAGTVTVSAYAVPRTTAQVDCAGMKTIPREGFNGWEVFDPADALATGSAEAPIRGGGDNGCNDGTIAFSITLQRPLASP
jgi:hypothetical protein